MKRLLGFSSVLLALTFVARAQALNETPRESSPEVRQKTFQKVWKTARDKFFDPNLNGVDWNAVHERYKPLVAAVKTDAELYETLSRMLGELHSSHMEIVRPEDIAAPAQPPVTTGLGLSTVEGRVVVVRILPGSSAESARVRPGYIAARIDGAPVKDLDDAFSRLRGEDNSKVRFTFLDELDQEREVVLDRKLMAPDQYSREKFGSITIYASLEVKRLESGIGYIRFTSFINPLLPKLEAVLQSLADSPGLIIDLRGNGGGVDNVAIKLAGHFFDKPTQLMISRTRKGDSLYYRARPVSHPFLKPLVLLVDERSASASEQLAAGLQESGRAYVIGRRTSGEDMDADITKLPTGAYLMYAAAQPRTPKGIVIDGRGVIPDLEVQLTRAELLLGNDSQLNAAVRYLAEKTRAAAR